LKTWLHPWGEVTISPYIVVLLLKLSCATFRRQRRNTANFCAKTIVRYYRVIPGDIITQLHVLPSKSPAYADKSAGMHQLLNRRCLRPCVLQLFLRRPLDYEKETEYQLGVMAIDAGTQPLTGRQTVSPRCFLPSLFAERIYSLARSVHQMFVT